MRSLNQGDDWEAISEDLTKGGKKGNVAFGTLTTISESPFQFGLIYTGSDDGLIQVTKNAGANWDVVSTNLPQDLWITRVIASQHKKERVYATLNGYRNDDFKSYVYMSDDYGQNWTLINAGIANAPVNVIKEDFNNENVLYLGTDNAAYVSFNKGEKWQIFKDIPAVAVHDLVIHEESGDLLLGTHGRSIYKTNIKSFEDVSDSFLNKDIVVFEVDALRYSKNWGSSWSKWLKPYEPSVAISVYSNKNQKLDIEILSEDKVLETISYQFEKGFNTISYDLTLNEKSRKSFLKKNTSIDIPEAKNGKYYLPKGDYLIRIGKNIQELEIK